jgi:glycopeptide antibiotics resistance protein
MIFLFYGRMDDLTARFFVITYLESLFCSVFICFLLFHSLTPIQAHIVLISGSPIIFTLFCVLMKKNLPDRYLFLGTLYLTWMSTLLLFRPSNFSIPGWNFIPFVHSIELLQNLSLKNMIWYFGGNTLLFLPMGVFFVYLTKSVRYPFIAGLILMTVIEVTQGLTGKGVCDIDDLLMNMFGIVIGSLMGISFIGIGKNQKALNINC